MKVKIGKGKKGSGYEMSFGSISASLEKVKNNATLNSIALQLAKQFKIKDGEIHLISIEFNYLKEPSKTK